MSHMKQLKSRKAEDRKQAIRMAAKALDRTALKQLARMAGDDPEPEIRKLAQQAGVYIRQKLGDLPGENAKPEQAVVSEENEAQAKRYLKAAMTATMQNDQAKSIKALSKALDLNPNLRTDGYFISLCEQATGAEGSAAITALKDESKLEETIKREARQRSEQDTIAHREKLNKITWNDTAFDYGLLAIISLIGGILMMFLAVQRADAFNSRYEQNQEDVALAIAEGRQAIEQNGSVKTDTYVREFPQAGQPIREFKDMYTVTETDYWTTIQYWRDLSFISVVITGILIGLAIVGTVVTLSVVAHFLAGGVFRRDGSLPYTMHQLGSFATARVGVMFAIIGISIFIFFGSPSEITLFAGILVLFLIITAISAIGIISKSYHMSAIQGSIATLSGASAAAGFALVSSIIISAI